MTVYIHLYSQSGPVIARNALNAYTKDGLYCVQLDEKTVHKFPVMHIFRIVEEQS